MLDYINDKCFNVTFVIKLNVSIIIKMYKWVIYPTETRPENQWKKNDKLPYMHTYHTNFSLDKKKIEVPTKN